MPEAENAVLDALDDRGIKLGQIVPIVEIDVAMDARGYSGKRVRGAVEVLVGRGLLRYAGASAVQLLQEALHIGDKKPRRVPRPAPRRTALSAI